MSSLLKISPVLSKFSRGQVKFTIILPAGTFTNVNGNLLIIDQQVLQYLNSGVKEILQALKKADKYRDDFSYDFYPSLQRPPRVRDGKIKIDFRIDRNSAASRFLGSLTGFQKLRTRMNWTDNRRSNDVNAHLQILILPMTAQDLQDQFCLVTGFRQFAPK
ncbi:hypothetical protein ACEPPN_005163 [Leptodophora sp. 'Broadleaf-Isolate-01']